MDAKQCCGTCRRWEPDRLSKLTGKGICRLDGKERMASDMNGCLGWKLADPWNWETRGYTNAEK